MGVLIPLDGSMIGFSRPYLVVIWVALLALVVFGATRVLRRIRRK
jgi:hypothetical protein